MLVQVFIAHDLVGDSQVLEPMDHVQVGHHEVRSVLRYPRLGRIYLGNGAATSFLWLKVGGWPSG